MVYVNRVQLALAILATLYLTGCGGIGPQTIPRDRFDYTSAISDSWKRQMLLNLVKVRYADAPVFLEVSSVINQYVLEGQIELNAAWRDGILGDSLGVGGIGKYSDRPTITYNPLLGDKFTRSLMTPIPPTAIFSLAHSGWPVDFVFRLAVQSINGVHNRSGTWLMYRQADPEFYRLLNGLRRIQASGAMGMRIDRYKDRHDVVMFFHHKPDKADIAAVTSVKKILGLRSKRQEYKIVYGAIPKDDCEIAILSRSMLKIMTELGSHIEVPERDVTENRVRPTLIENTDAFPDLNPLIRIQSNIEKPADAFVAVRYRDYWFWIDDRDFPSKRVFSFLMILFTLAETGGSEHAPIVTIPAG